MRTPASGQCPHLCRRGDCEPARVRTLSAHRQEDQGTHMCLGMDGEVVCLHACVPVCGTNSELGAVATATVLWERSMSE